MRMSDWSSDVCASDLLLDPVARQRPAGMERIAVAAERMPRDRQEDALLVLPDVRHLVDEQPLVGQRRIGEIVAIERASGVEMDAARGRHDDEIGRVSCRESVSKYV